MVDPYLIFQKEVERLLLAAAKQRDRCLLMTAYATGLRVSELVRLKVSAPPAPSVWWVVSCLWCRPSGYVPSCRTCPTSEDSCPWQVRRPMPLSTSSSVILIPSGATTGNVTISWDFGFVEIMLEERTHKVGSTAVFTRRLILDTETQVGSYVQALRPGDVYEVRAFRRGFDPTGMSDEEAARWTLGGVLVHALGLMTQLESDHNERVGGTFYRYSCATGSTLTHGFMEVGKGAPVADVAGFSTMASPIMTVKSFTPANLHRLSTDKVIGMLSSEIALS